VQYVELLNQYEIAAIMDLHWTAPGSQPATGQLPMPDSDHSVLFWLSVAETFKNNTSVIFDLFNEPYPDYNQDTTAAWTCWRDGGTCSGVNFNVAGMQNLTSSVRSTGAQNIIVLGGLEYSNCLTHWLDYMPHDPSGNLAASWHSYNFNLCSNENCWNSYIAPVAAKVPLMATEFGENDCATNYINPLMNWMNQQRIHYLAWTWDTWGCTAGPCLISDYSGTPTPYGQGLYNELTSQ